MSALHQRPRVPSGLRRLSCTISRLSQPEAAAQPSRWRLRRALLLLAYPALVTLTGCPSTATRLKIKPPQLQAVQIDLKRQLGVYLAERAKRKPPVGPLDCGKGDIDFMVTTVTMDLKTTIEWTRGVGGKGTVGSPIAVLLPSATGTHENSQHLTFTQTLMPPALQDPALFDPKNVALLEQKPSAIADAIFALRDGLVAAAMRAPDGSRLPCMTIVAGDAKDQGGTFVIGITVSSDLSGSITLGALDWGPMLERKASNENALTVTFVPVSTNLPVAVPPANGPGQPADQGGPIAHAAKRAACKVKSEDINTHVLCTSPTKHDVTFCDTCGREIGPGQLNGVESIMRVTPHNDLR